MTPKIKFLLLSLVAASAMSGLAASAAQAGNLDIGVQPAVITGHLETGQNTVFTLTSTAGGKFNTSCKKHTLESTTQGTSVSEWTATTTKTECTAFGVAAQVLLNGCKDTFTGAGQPANTWLVDIVGCTSGKSIEIKTAICTLDIPEQNGLSHAVTTNINAQQVTLATTASGITVRQTGAACPDGNNHVSTTGSSTGNYLLTARVDPGGHQVTKHSHQYSELTCTGAQVNISST